MFLFLLSLKLRNNKEKAYFARLDKGKSSDVDAEISKPTSKPTVREYNKSVFVPIYYLCGVVCHIRPNCSLLRQKPKSKTRFVVRNTDVPKFVPVCHFCGVSGHIRPNCHKLKFKHSVFQSRIFDDISPAISPYKLFPILLKNLNLLACERNLQDFSISQKIDVIPQIHCFSWIFTYKAEDSCYMGEKRFSKVSVVSLVPDLILSIIYGHVLFLFLAVLFFRLFFIFFLNPKILKNFKKI